MALDICFGELSPESGELGHVDHADADGGTVTPSDNSRPARSRARRCARSSRPPVRLRLPAPVSLKSTATTSALNLNPHVWTRSARRSPTGSTQGLSAFLDVRQDGGVVGETDLDDFGKSRQKIVRGERSESVHVAQHSVRAVERSDQVLASIGVDTRLTADGGVHHGEHRCGNLNHLHATQPGRCNEIPPGPSSHRHLNQR